MTHYIVALGIFKKKLSSPCIIHKENQPFSSGLISHNSSCYYIHTNKIFNTGTKMFLRRGTVKDFESSHGI